VAGAAFILIEYVSFVDRFMPQTTPRYNKLMRMNLIFVWRERLHLLQLRPYLFALAQFF